MEKTYNHQEGMIINCTLKTSEINPKEVSYTWFTCESTGTCDHDSSTIIRKSPSLQLPSQKKHTKKYLCRAENDAGSDNETIEVIKAQVVSKCTDLKKLLY